MAAEAKPVSLLHLRVCRSDCRRLTSDPFPLQVKTYEYYAGMTCGGCKGAVTRILGKLDGITEFTADVEKKQVLVTGESSGQPLPTAADTSMASLGKQARSRLGVG